MSGRSSRWARKPARSVWICPSIMPAPSFAPRWGRCSIRQPTRWWMRSASERKSCMADASIQIEVVYASVQRQVLKTVDVPAGSSVRQALALSGMDKEFPELDLSQCAVGIFGKVVADPAARVLEAGERIEIYRPLVADPMEIRRLRAAKAREKRTPLG
ncbi:hypothetical protein ALP25_05010 [Pseudomonas syringae pv. syringae]|nr:hypothetical protein ALP25_05010 [Pseudomonas syringae pv. syringae]